MDPKFILTTFLFVLSTLLFCQDKNEQNIKVEFGPRAGASYTTIINNDNISFLPKIGINAGLYQRTEVHNNFSFSNELIVYQAGAIFTNTLGADLKYNLAYVGFNTFGDLRLYKGLYVNAGIGIGYLINAREKGKTNQGSPFYDNDLGNNFENVESRYIIGLTYYFVDGQFVSVRQSTSLGNINTDKSAIFKNSIVTIIAGINIFKD